MLLCLRLLSTHLSLAMAGGVVGSVLGNQARPLRNLLFRLVDTTMPQTVENVRSSRADQSHYAVGPRLGHEFCIGPNIQGFYQFDSH